jgi:antitoxin component of RelBE/YafQ-DinJ toxin-antitoxin module
MLSVLRHLRYGAVCVNIPPCPAFYSALLPLHLIIKLPLSECNDFLKLFGLCNNVTIFLRQVILNNGIPFPIKAPAYSDETIAALREAESIAKNGPHRFNTTDEMFKELGI